SFKDEYVVHFMAGATTGNDMYDTEKLFNDEPWPNLYSYSFAISQPPLAVNGLPPALLEQQEIVIPLLFMANTDSLCTIEMKEMYDFPEDFRFLLIDSLESYEHDLYNDGIYTFINTGTESGRFYMKIISDNVSGIGSIILSGISEIDCSCNRIIIRNYKSVENPVVEIFDLTGKKVISRKPVNGRVDFSVPVDGYYVVRITDDKLTFSKLLYLANYM
ncbi:MAG: T9SS type A sorting domain-containing protein, partial [Bacteroidetes bacterium]|nr:T9SS type A sorting domain-containing protein [Bacteroidota bacterium]